MVRAETIQQGWLIYYNGYWREVTRFTVPRAGFKSMGGTIVNISVYGVTFSRRRDDFVMVFKQ